MAAALSAIFFASGVAALIFETLWFRQSGLAFGNSVWASSLVLSSFMAGLALGNGLVTRLGPRIRRPVRLYAGLEVAIAVGGCALVFSLPALSNALAPILRPLLDDLLLLNPVRLAIAFVLLLLPATAMGATMPLLVRALRERGANFGAILGRLYGWNTLGAVLGAVAGELWLIEQVGIRGSALVAGGIDLIAGGAALLLSRRLEGTAGDTALTPPSLTLNLTVQRLGAAAFLAGFALLALEVVWFRFLQLFVVPSGLAFSVMLAVVLAGIGLGGFVAGLWLRFDAGAFRHAGATAFATGAVCVLLFWSFGFAVEPYTNQRVLDASGTLWLAVALMFPVALLSGVIFPLTGAALERRVGNDIQSAGFLTLSNTTGAGLGSFMAGFVLLPWLGVELSLFALAGLYGITALLLMPSSDALSRWLRPALAASAAAALLASLVLFPFGALEERFLTQALRPFGYPGQAKIAAMAEGRTETVVFLRGDLLDEPMYYRLVTGGFGMASSKVLNRRYMKLYVYWPAALHPKLESALLISYGIGNTAKAMTDTKSLERIDVVDISREILELSSVVFPDDENPLRDPRVNVFVEDGRYFLQSRPNRYDLITSEPPPPKHAGVVNLYTREYFQLIHDHLNEGGLSTYWLPVHSLSESDTQAIIRAYCEVFEDCTLWSGWEWNWMLCGSRNGNFEPSREAFGRQWSDPVVAPELAALGFEQPEQLGSLFMADREDLLAWTRAQPPLSDDFPKRLDDLYLSKSEKLAAYGPWIDVETTRRRFLASEFVEQSWPEGMREDSIEHFADQRAINELIGGLRPTPPGFDVTWNSIHRVISQTDLRTLFLWHLAISADDLDAMDRLLARGGPDGPHLMRLGARALAERDFDAAADYFGRGQLQQPGLVYLHVYALCLAGRTDEARGAVRAVLGRIALGGADAGYWQMIEREFGVNLLAG